MRLPVRQTRDHNSGPEPRRAQKPGLDHGQDRQALGVGQDLWRDDLVGPKRLPRVDERGQRACCLLALAYGPCQRPRCGTDGEVWCLLLMEEGRGLLMPNGILPAMGGFGLFQRLQDGSALKDTAWER